MLMVPHLDLKLIVDKLKVFFFFSCRCNPENSFQTSLLTFDTEQLGFRHMRRYCHTKQCLVKTTRKREKDHKKKLKFHRKPWWVITGISSFF